MKIEFKLLGQSGCRFVCGDSVIYMDPYLSNSVQELDASDLNRLSPIPLQPHEVTDADWVLITHEHIDHCDPYTIPFVANASPQCRFMGPTPVLKRLLEWGIPKNRCQLAEEHWSTLNAGARVKAIPAAHPTIERDARGNLHFVGYLIEVNSKKLYLAGDTSVSQELIDTLKSERPIAAAMLPVNESNFFRTRRGIIGNMSIREAFLLATEIGVETVIPVHWDMFEINSVDAGEIEAVYRRMQPDFTMNLHPTSIVM